MDQEDPENDWPITHYYVRISRLSVRLGSSHQQTVSIYTLSSRTSSSIVHHIRNKRLQTRRTFALHWKNVTRIFVFSPLHVVRSFFHKETLLVLLSFCLKASSSPLPCCVSQRSKVLLSFFPSFSLLSLLLLLLVCLWSIVLSLPSFRTHTHAPQWRHSEKPSTRESERGKREEKERIERRRRSSP